MSIAFNNLPINAYSVPSSPSTHSMQKMHSSAHIWLQKDQKTFGVKILAKFIPEKRRNGGVGWLQAEEVVHQ